MTKMVTPFFVDSGFLSSPIRYFAKPNSEAIPHIRRYKLIAMDIKTRIDHCLLLLILMSPVTKAATAMPAIIVVKV
jgi:hypothetical protein